MTTEELRKFALMGARARIETLRQEVESIRAAFPELQGAKASAPKIVYAAKSSKKRTSAAKYKPRRQHSGEFKARIFAELAKGKTPTELAKTYGIRDSLIYNWKRGIGYKKPHAGKRPTPRTHSAEFKAKVVAEVASGQSMRAVAKAHNIAQPLLGRWVKAAKAASK